MSNCKLCQSDNPEAMRRRQEGLKRCLACLAWKPREDFPPQNILKSGGMGRNARCRACLGCEPAALSNKKGTFTPNRYRVEGEGEGAVGIIELTDRNDRTIAEALVSASDLPAVIAAGRWYAAKREHTWYAAHSHRRAGKAGVSTLHRFITNAPAGLVVDHINGQGLDNRRENLRVVTHTENSINTRHHRDALAQAEATNRLLLSLLLASYQTARQ